MFKTNHNRQGVLLLFACFFICVVSSSHAQSRIDPDVNALNIKNINAKSSVDCGEWAYYSLYVPPTMRAQDVFLSFRFTKEYPDTTDKQALTMYLRLNQLPNTTFYDAKTSSPTVPISFNKIQPNSTVYVAILGVGMCQEGSATTNNYYFWGYMTSEPPIPGWLTATIVIGGCGFMTCLVVLIVGVYRFVTGKRRRYVQI